MSLTKVLQDEVNLLAGIRADEVGLDHAYLLGAQNALEWMLGGDTPHAQFYKLREREPICLS